MVGPAVSLMRDWRPPLPSVAFREGLLIVIVEASVERYLFGFLPPPSVPSVPLVPAVTCIAVAIP
jgi:hypothetical protein